MKAIVRVARMLIGLTLQGIFVGILVVSCTSLAVAQSQGGGVSLNNLNLSLTIPILVKQGRGITLNYALNYNSAFYSFLSEGESSSGGVIGTPPPLGLLGGYPSFGWNASANSLAAPFGWFGTPSVQSQSSTCGSGTLNSNFTFVDPQGGSHPLPTSVITSDDPTCGPAQASGYAVDQSGYFITANSSGSGVAQDVAGNTYGVSGYPGTTLRTDRNGNYTSFDFSTNTLKDTLGVTAALTLSSTTYSNGIVSSVAYTYPAAGGVNASVVINYKVYPRVATGFGCPGLTEFAVLSNGAGAAMTPGVPLVDNIVLPDNSKYTFQYEPTPTSSTAWVSGAVTGRLQSMTYPTGATVTYTYPGPNGGVNCADGTAMRLTVTTSDGSTTYTRSISGTTATTTMTDPQGNQTVASFVQLTNPRITSPPTSFSPPLPTWIETQRNIYQGSGTPLKTILQCFNGNKSNCNTTPVSMPITETSTFELLPNGKENERDTFGDSNTGAPTEVDEYDFGTGQPGPLLRKTVTSYASLGNNIISQPASITVCSPAGTDADCKGAGTKVSQTTFNYDETPVAVSSGISQHVAVSGARGNVTSVHDWVNTSNTTLTTVNTYDDTGNVLTTTEAGGHTTLFGYSCNGAFLATITKPDTNSHHIRSVSYDCTTGLLSSTTDQNGNVTRFSFDGMFRPTEVDYPDGGQTLTSYPDPNHLVVQRKIDGSRFTYASIVLDSYGRLAREARRNDEATPYDQQDFCYDANGRQSFSSYPYQGNAPTAAPACPITSEPGDSFTYDAMGRLTKIQHSDGSVSTTTYTGRAAQTSDEGNGNSVVSRILQSDALGHLVSVCELYSGAQLLGSGGIPTSCGLDIVGTGFLTSYTYDTLDNLVMVTQGNLTNRTYAYDSLSRLVSQTSPEAGTSSYTYNADGLLATRVRPAANQTNPTVTTTTNYQYDALHRMTSRSYTDGVTSQANFLYDTAATQWSNPSVTQKNLIGRLSQEWTVSPGGTMLSGSAFGYDPMGRILANNQCTPLDCGTGNRPLGYSYDFLGNVISASNGVGVTFTQSYNIAGLLTGMSSSLSDANHPNVLLAGAHYSPAVITETLGNGVSEITNFSARGLLQSQQALLPSSQSSTASVTVTGHLNLASSTSGTPPPNAATSSGLTSYFDTNGLYHVVYEAANQHIYDVYTPNSGVGAGYTDVTLEAGSPLAATGSATTFFFDSYNVPNWTYVGTDQNVYLVYQNSDGYFYVNLNSWSGGSPLAENVSPLTSSFQSSNKGQTWSYLGSNRHIYMMFNYSGSSGPAYADVTAAAGAPAAASGSPLTFFLDINNDPHWTYVGSDQNVYLIYNTSPTSGTESGNWHYVNLNTWSGGSPAAVSGSALTSSFQASDFGQIWSYFNSNQHIYMMFNYSGSSGPAYVDVTAAAGAPAAASGSPLTFFLDIYNDPHWTYVGSDQNVYLIYNTSPTSGTESGNWHYLNLNTWSGGSPAAMSGSALTVSFQGSNYEQSWSYLGSNQHIYDMFNYNGSPGPAYKDLMVTTPNMASDSGTVSLNVGGFTATACFGPSTTSTCTGQSANDSLSAVAAALASALNSSSSPATATASGSTINMIWKTSGPLTPAVSALTTIHDNPSLFSSPSFTSVATSFSAGSSGPPAYSYVLGEAPNGEITSANDLVNGNWAYAYDPFNRLVSSNKNSGQQTFSYVYDRYGNRAQQNAPQGGPAPQYLFDTNNHFVGSGVTYDALGEVLTDGLGNSFTWDAEGRLIQVNQGSTVTATYVYDAAGHRVSGPNGEYIYDKDGRMITQFGLNGVWAYGEIYASGKHLATYSGGTTNFFHPDWLGTKRVMTGVNGTVSETCTGLPFGDGVSCSGTNWSFNSFTDDIHDPETNLEHTLFRKYSGTQGRFLTPDPYSGSADPVDPQSWNRYAYGNPLSGADPSGLLKSQGSCAFGMGINTKPGGHANDVKNMSPVIYPYPKGGKGEGVKDVLDQDLNGANNNTAIMAGGLNQLKDSPPHSVTLFLWSGAAQATSTAIQSGMVTQSAVDAIQNVIYFSPGTGAFSDLFGLNLPGSMKFHGTGFADWATTFFSRFHGGHGEKLPCSHGDLQCMQLNAYAKHPNAFQNCPPQSSLDAHINPFPVQPLDLGSTIWGDFTVSINGDCPTCSVTTNQGPGVLPNGQVIPIREIDINLDFSWWIDL